MILHKENEDINLSMKEVEILINLCLGKLKRAQKNMTTRNSSEVDYYLIRGLTTGALFMEEWTRAQDDAKQLLARIKEEIKEGQHK